MMENAMTSMGIFAKRTKVYILIFQLMYCSNFSDSTILFKMVSVVYNSNNNFSWP